ncbi:MBL fold metallo-hydrolase [Kribbella sp. CA-294648]|uniref:MBL fold metallo-hydrolase n=1 Tax=Kribbella sp. CA-294648 TaxID=3239948 RepID=UPI003D8A4B0D
MNGEPSKMIVPVVDEGLGNSSYLVDLGDGRALAVDPCLDLRALRTHAERRGLTVAFAADTHLHADFLSGAVQLAAVDGSRLLASAAGGREFTHDRLSDGDEVDLGGLTLRALATPGHTGEHLSFELLDGTERLGVFTGGSLIVGGAARTDLAGADQTEQLSRLQYRSLRRLFALPEATTVWPTHGTGSFCSAPGSGERVTTIGREMQTNLLLQAPDEDAFVEQLLAGLGSFPPYFLRLPEANRRGPALLEPPLSVPALSADRFTAAVDAGAVVVDVRPIHDFATGHVPGAISIALRAQFTSWLGWLLEPDAEYVVVRNPDQDLDDLAWQAAKIGFNLPQGELAGGMAGWNRQTETTPLLAPEQAAGERVLDVRQASEYHSGHVPGAQHLELGALRDRAEAIDTGPMVVMCGHGERAMTGASLLQRAGHRAVRVLDGGPDQLAAATGRALV